MKIFVIDDEKLLLDSARRIIGEVVPDSEIQLFSDADDALEMIISEEVKPDVVFSDIEMPGISGLELAVKIKNHSPKTRIIFVTGYSKYAIDAFKVHVHGYLLKPLTVEDVRNELNDIPEMEPVENDKLQIRCFGHFEVFWKGNPVIFTRKQTKEMLAFLIDREGATCTSSEIGSALWEDLTDSKIISQRVRNLISDLKGTLKKIGMEDILIRERQQITIRIDKIDCDYYKMLAGNMEQMNAYRGEYMLDYSWAELTAGKLYFREKK